MIIKSEPFLDFEEKILGTHFKYIFTKYFLFWLFQSNLHLCENCWRNSRANENETILENESCDVFSNQVLMEEEPLTKMMEKNRSLQIQSNIINKDEKMMKLNLYV
jgi:hypothetical protein